MTVGTTTNATASTTSESRPRTSTQSQQHNDFLCRPRYAGQLPPLPFPPKLINLPPTVERFSAYRHTSLVQNTAYPMMTGWQLGMPVELLELGVFDTAAGIERTSNVPPPIDPKDQALFAKPIGVHAHLASSTASVYGPVAVTRGRPNVPWLRRNEYHSIEMGRNTAAKEAAGKLDARINAQNNTETPERIDCSREAQIRLIEESFEKIESLDLSQLRHPKNPSLRAVESIPLLPDHADNDDLFTAYTHCIFERPPGVSAEEELDTSPESIAMRKALVSILKPMEDVETGEKFLACFLPTGPSLEKIEDNTLEEKVNYYLIYSYKDGSILTRY
jgi:RNA polymerase II-associated factor 1